MKKVGLFSMVFIALFFMVMGANSQSVVFSKLTSENEALRKESKNTILSISSITEKQNVSQEILSVLQQNTTLSKPIQGDLIETLGKLKRPEAIPYLVDHINFSAVTEKYLFIISPMSEEYYKNRYKFRPAEYTLIDIGEPAIPYLLDRLRKVDNAQNYVMDAIRTIVGSEKTKMYLGQLIKEEKDETKRSKLERWRKSFER